ncbi:MAG TPA: DUF484 family protein [Alphaproteobacteria bacterium]|nr:DUF484 family protein [Alphaproteobacteria bacterium]
MQKPNEHSNAAPAESLNAAQVLDFLRAHPDFLGKYAEVLAPLLSPERSSGDHVVDLQRFMVERLKARSRELEDEREQMVGLARLNLKSQTRVHRAVLALMSAQSFEHLIQAVTIDLPVFLGLDLASLCIETTGAAPTHKQTAGVRVIDAGAVDRLLGPARDMLLRPKVRGDAALFGAGATLVRSDALLRLKIGPSAPAGLLALASRKDGRFHPGQGTELLSFLARSIELSIRTWLDLPL